MHIEYECSFHIHIDNMPSFDRLSFHQNIHNKFLNFKESFLQPFASYFLNLYFYQSLIAFQTQLALIPLEFDEVDQFAVYYFLNRDLQRLMED